MIETCPACNTIIRWYHKTGCNGSWHKLCWIAWLKGYDTAAKWADEECRDAGYPTPFELYSQKNDLGWRVKKDE